VIASRSYHAGRSLIHIWIVPDGVVKGA